MQKNNRSYKDLKQKQKSAIADKTYSMYLAFYLENHRIVFNIMSVKKQENA